MTDKTKMTSLEFTQTLDAPEGPVWEAISSFHGIERWLPIIKASVADGNGVGATRTCTLHDGAELRERLDELDPAARRLSYAITDAPLPISGYRATMTVTTAGTNRCTLGWCASFEVAPEHEAAMTELFRGAYAAGAAGLQQLCRR